MRSCGSSRCRRRRSPCSPWCGTWPRWSGPGSAGCSRITARPWSGPTKIDFQAAYDASASTRAEAFAAWEAEVETSRRIERAAESLDLSGYQPRWEEDVSLRLVMMHVLLEYARHNGHADFLREGVDGTVGA